MDDFSLGSIPSIDPAPEHGISRSPDRKQRKRPHQADPDPEPEDVVELTGSAENEAESTGDYYLPSQNPGDA